MPWWWWTLPPYHGQRASCTLPLTVSCRAISRMRVTDKPSRMARRAWVLGQPRRSAVARLVTSNNTALAEVPSPPHVLMAKGEKPHPLTSQGGHPPAPSWSPPGCNAAWHSPPRADAVLAPPGGCRRNPLPHGAHVTTGEVECPQAAGLQHIAPPSLPQCRTGRTSRGRHSGRHCGVGCCRFDRNTPSGRRTGQSTHGTVGTQVG